jgi:DNA-binding LytR/AlgR family response regulator
MRELEEKLSGTGFFRGNKGYLINLAFVEGVQESCAVVDGKMLPLSRARKKEFLSALNLYWGDVMR